MRLSPKRLPTLRQFCEEKKFASKLAKIQSIGGDIMEPTSVSQCLETPWISKVGIDRLDEKWQCEGKERPFAPKPRFYTETKRINIVTEFYKRFPKTKDSQNEKSGRLKI